MKIHKGAFAIQDYVFTLTLHFSWGATNAHSPLCYVANEKMRRNTQKNSSFIVNFMKKANNNKLAPKYIP